MEPSANWDDRTVRLLGAGAVDSLGRSRVLVVGVGGVGGYAAEMLARAGVGHLTLVDADAVEATNLNRQIIATRSALGRPKVEVFAERFADINPLASIDAVHDFLTVDNLESIMARGYDFVIDAIDTVAPKVALLSHCLRRRIPVISSMGAGGRTDPTKVRYMDLWDTRDDGLARAVRQRFKKEGLRRPLTVVASTEPPHTASIVEVGTRNKRTSYGTLATIPSLFGIYLANHVILRLASPPRPTATDNTENGENTENTEN